MRTLKWTVFGIAMILFGLCAILLSGLPDVPTFHNGILELLESSGTGAAVAEGPFSVPDQQGEGECGREAPGEDRGKDELSV